MITIGKRIGKQIAAARKAMGFTQGQLADQIGYCRNSVTNWERGVTTPTATELVALAELLDCSVCTLLDVPCPMSSLVERIPPA